MLWIHQVGNFGRQETIKYIKKTKKKQKSLPAPKSQMPILGKVIYCSFKYDYSSLCLVLMI